MLSRLLVVAVAMGGLTLVSGGAVPAGEERDSKLFPIVQLVNFDNTACYASNGDHGTCYSQKECDGFGGTASGTCASGFGVCCVLTATCEGTITVNGTYFISSGASNFGSCAVDIVPPPGTCQILLEMEEFNIAGPVEGDCSNDTFVVMGANPGSQIPTLCGYNSGQHMYIDVDNTDGPHRLMFTFSALGINRNWKIKVIFLDEYNPCKAPNRCLQYFKETSGTISSFNYAPTNPIMLTEQNYAICFAYVPGYCDIGMNFNRFDHGNVQIPCDDDYICLGCTKVCGDYTGNYAAQLNATGPLSMQVVSDMENSNLEEGFSATYMMMPC